jgi:hypothetical protein
VHAAHYIPPVDIEMMELELLMNTTTWWLEPNDTIIDNGNQSFFSTSTTADPAFVRFRDESRFWVQRVSRS